MYQVIDIEVDNILSINEAYAPQVTSSGKPYKYMPQYVKDYVSELEEKIIEKMDPQYVGVKPTTISYIFVVKREVDTTNMVTLVENALKRAIQVDDRHFDKVTLMKLYLDNARTERIIIALTYESRSEQ